MVKMPYNFNHLGKKEMWNYQQTYQNSLKMIKEIQERISRWKKSKNKKKRKNKSLVRVIQPFISF